MGRNLSVSVDLATLFCDVGCVCITVYGTMVVSSCHSDDIDFLVPLREQQESVFVSIYNLLSQITALKPLCDFIVVC
jgi:hypothetical protein